MTMDKQQEAAYNNLLWQRDNILEEIEALEADLEMIEIEIADIENLE